MSKLVFTFTQDERAALVLALDIASHGKDEQAMSPKWDALAARLTADLTEPVSSVSAGDGI